MRIEQVDLADAAQLRACHDVYLAADHEDVPDEPVLGERLFGCWLAMGWDGNPREVWTVREPANGSVAGYFRLELPELENREAAFLDVVVHPERRRRGFGRDLLRHAAERAAVHGRSVLYGGVRNDTPGEAFARVVGAALGLVDIQRVLDVRRLTPAALGQIREPAERAAGEYRLVRWIGPIPEEFLEPVAGIYAALNDAPLVDGIEPAGWDARRVRERVNEPRSRYGTRLYAVAARHEASGELAALTEVSVDPADPGWGFQLVTAVTRKHRGHRLGLLVKTGMLDWLLTAEPAVQRIMTWNAQDNKHMIAVNEELGYTVLGRPETHVHLDVAAARVACGRVWLAAGFG